jgi:probable phosphoglycerate mutase
MLRIVLIRPGSTDYDQEERIQGALDIPLSAQGSSEVARIAEELQDKEIELVYSSPGQPVQQSAEAIAAGLHVKWKRLLRMQNLNHGLWQGMLLSEVRHKQPKVYRQWQEQPENVCPPEGEMLSAAQERVRVAMTKLLKRHKEGVIALVVAEPLATLVRQFIKHDELGDLWKAIGTRGCWEILEVEPANSLALSN